MKTSVKDITKDLSYPVFGFGYFYTYNPVIQVFNIVELKNEFYAANSQLVYSIVYPNKKTNQSGVTPSGWLSTVGPAGLEPATP